MNTQDVNTKVHEAVQLIDATMKELLSKKTLLLSMQEKMSRLAEDIQGAEEVVQAADALLGGESPTVKPGRVAVPTPAVVHAAATSHELQTSMVAASKAKLAEAKTPLPVGTRLGAKIKEDAKVESVEEPQDQPHLREAMIRVMGRDHLRAPDIYRRIVEHGWKVNGQNPVQYLSMYLSKEKDLFARDEGQRGVYHVIPHAKMPRGSSFESTDFVLKKASPKAHAETPAKSVATMSEKEIQQELGIDDESADAPFGE